MKKFLAIIIFCNLTLSSFPQDKGNSNSTWEKIKQNLNQTKIWINQKWHNLTSKKETPKYRCAKAQAFNNLKSNNQNQANKKIDN